MRPRSQIDALGDRLRDASVTDADRAILDEYRVGFRSAFDSVMDLCRGLDLKPTGRFGKSTRSIVAKLTRESVRLSQVQDIVGCRIVLSEAAGSTSRGIQDENVRRILDRLEAEEISYKVYDRRVVTSHGYRAVHVVALPDGKPVEIQVRTYFQHYFAQMVEFVADQLGSDVKYGGGHVFVRDSLTHLSDFVDSIEVSKDSADESAKGSLGGALKGLGKVVMFAAETYHLGRTLEVLGAEQSDLFSSL